MLPTKVMNKFRKQHFNEDMAPREICRLGGHGFWIQQPYEDLVLQITSDPAAEFCFGDAGSIYVVGREIDQLTAVMDCY